MQTAIESPRFGRAPDPAQISRAAVGNLMALRGKVTASGHFDYGRGGWYQSLHSLGLTGLRDTEWRTEAYELPSLLEGRNVLDLGCHSGFFAPHLDSFVRGYRGVDHNPALIRMGQVTADHFGLRNVGFELGDLFDTSRDLAPFDAIMLFSAHISFEANCPDRLRDLIGAIAERAGKGALLLLESHPPDFEARGPGLQWLVDLVERSFRRTGHSAMSGNGMPLDEQRDYFVFERR